MKRLSFFLCLLSLLSSCEPFREILLKSEAEINQIEKDSEPLYKDITDMKNFLQQPAIQNTPFNLRGSYET